MILVSREEAIAVGYRCASQTYEWQRNLKRINALLIKSDISLDDKTRVSQLTDQLSQILIISLYEHLLSIKQLPDYLAEKSAHSQSLKTQF